MQKLKDKIIKYAKVPADGVIKVDSFLNHIIEPELIIEIGEFLADKFRNSKVDKILTIEASGIAPALGTAIALKVPVLFAKKSKPSTMLDGYTADVYSFTKKTDYTIFVSKEYLKKGENILIIDDFLAYGRSIVGMKKVIDDAFCKCVGVGIVIEKSFQKGRETLESSNIRIESAVSIKSATTYGGIEFL